MDGKRVVLVGPSRSIKGRGEGPAIDAYDIVVRVNWQWPIPEDMVPDLGRRMDVLYHCSKNEPYARHYDTLFDVPDFQNISMVYYFTQMPDGKRFGEMLSKAGIPHTDLRDYCCKLREVVKGELNTGFIAICHLLESQLQELYITGFSFHREPYYEGYCSANWWDEKGNFVSRGNPDLHLNHFIKMFYKDRRIKLDPTLRNIVAQKGLM